MRLKTAYMDMIISCGNILCPKNWCACNYDNINETLLPKVPFAIILASAILLSLLTCLILVKSQTSQLIFIPPQSVYGQTVPQGSRCNCIIDYTSSGHSTNNITGITIPKLNLLKNETLQSQTEGPLSRIAIKSTQLMSILTKDFSLGNFTGGPGASVTLNTINLRPNESLGVQIYGGKIPKPIVVKGEIVRANVNTNGSLQDIKVVGNKISEFQLHYSKSIKKSVLGVNRFLVNVKEPGYYLLLMSLGYNLKSNNNNTIINTTSINDNFIGGRQTRYPLIPIYETLLKIG
jgi:hypothetical protein